MTEMTEIDCRPTYLYHSPMFMITVSVVLIIDNGVLLIRKQTNPVTCAFPGGDVKAGQESIQFAAVRYVKEQTGILLQKDLLIPVDFRSDPSRSSSGNIMDLGFACMVNEHDVELKKTVIRKEVDFENKKILSVDDNWSFYMDHGILLERAIDVILMYKLPIH